MNSWSLAIVATVVLGYAGLSRRIERTVITAPIAFVTAGLFMGGEALGWFDLSISNGGVRALAEATLTLVLFADASRIVLPALRAYSGCRPACWHRVAAHDRRGTLLLVLEEIGWGLVGGVVARR